MKRNISKKPVIILGTLLTLLVTVTVVYGVSNLEPKDVELNQLIEAPYKVLDVRRDKKEKTYEVDIKADLNYADNILLANKLLSELQKTDPENVAQVHMNVYKEKTDAKSVDFTDPNYRYTIETNGSYTYQYEPIYTENLSENLILTTEWKIEDSQLTKNNLSFNASIPDNLSPEEINSLLNELSDEMMHYNFENKETATTTIQAKLNTSDTYYHLSENNHYLIHKTRLIG
ncbi:MAG: hypothetical protein K2G70_03075 [Turicibacter sp.]|nr:hypothetical protein [Turicibacter sp.]